MNRINEFLILFYVLKKKKKYIAIIDVDLIQSDYEIYSVKIIFSGNKYDICNVAISWGEKLLLSVNFPVVWK